MSFDLWTDGACRQNPGPGGWAYILLNDGKVVDQQSGGDPNTTNNRMEIRAVIEGLATLKNPSTITVHLDSAYVQHAFTRGWLRSWQKNNWRTRKQKPVKNRELWQQLLAAAAPHQITWLRIKGHAGIHLNEACDRLATQAALAIQTDNNTGGLRIFNAADLDPDTRARYGFT
jgi:ribonuclease HI